MVDGGGRGAEMVVYEPNDRTADWRSPAVAGFIKGRTGPPCRQDGTSNRITSSAWTAKTWRHFWGRSLHYSGAAGETGELDLQAGRAPVGAGLHLASPAMERRKGDAEGYWTAEMWTGSTGEVPVLRVNGQTRDGQKSGQPDQPEGAGPMNCAFPSLAPPLPGAQLKSPPQAWEPIPVRVCRW